MIHSTCPVNMGQACGFSLDCRQYAGLYVQAAEKRISYTFLAQRKNAYTLVLTTLPVDGAPCKFCDRFCRKLLSVAPLLLAPSAASRLLKLCCNASSGELDVVDAEPDALESDDVEPEVLESDVDVSWPDDNCEIRFCKPLSNLLTPPPPPW